MARAPRDDDDDVPWLAEGVREERSTLVPRGRLIGGGLIAVLLAVLVAVGVYLAIGHKSDGSSGYANPADAPLIAADAGPYKVPPADPGGAQIAGLDDGLAAAADGGDVGSAIAMDEPEEPLARPGTPEAANAPPTDLLPATIPPAPTRVPEAPVVAPTATAKPSATSNAPSVVPAAKPAPSVTPSTTPTAKPASATKPESKPVKAETPRAKPAAKSDAAPDPLTAPVKTSKPKLNVATVKAAIDDAKPASKVEPKLTKAATLQLGAFSTREKAEAAWVKAGGDGALSGLGQRIEPIERGGTTLYRLRAAGVASKDAAKALCARVTAAGNACIVAE